MRAACTLMAKLKILSDFVYQNSHKSTNQSPFLTNIDECNLIWAPRWFCCKFLLYYSYTCLKCFCIDKSCWKASLQNILEDLLTGTDRRISPVIRPKNMKCPTSSQSWARVIYSPSTRHQGWIVLWSNNQPCQFPHLPLYKHCYYTGAVDICEGFVLLCRDKSYAYSLATIKDPIFGDAEIMMRAQLSPQLEMKCPEWVLGTSNYPTLNGLKP